MDTSLFRLEDQDMSNDVTTNELSYTISARGKTDEIPVMDFLRENFSAIPLKQIDSLFGFVERCTLYGGRPFVRRQLSDADVLAMYENSIGVRIPLTNLFVSDQEYNNFRWLFEKYHRIGNSIISTDDTLASWIRRDYPNYRLEASVIKNIDTYEKIRESLDIYDTVILPMRLNLHYEFLDNIREKQRITLFANAGCAFNCPAKICYQTISGINKFDGRTQFRCSKATIPREELGMVDFDLKKLSSIGFTRFKLLRSMPGGVTGF
jgi:hypothetical protein